jgi:hypothetical protein
VTRRGLALCLVLLLAALLFTGNRIAEHILNRQLPPLLTEELGLPVTLAPLDADLLTLSASTDRLVMGDPDSPAIDASNVRVSLSMSALLEGEIRLKAAQGEDLTVALSRWPTTDSPWPEDYYFLDQWLPKRLNLVKGRYVAKDGDNWPLRDLEWRRSREGASLGWTEDRAQGDVRIDTNLASLQALLGMSGFELQINLDVPETPDSELQLAINPVSAGGYALRVEGKLADSALELEAGSPESWSFPAHSKTRVDRLRLTPLRALLAGLDRDKVDRDLEEWLESAVPNLSLPEHEARLAIGEIRMDDEMLRDTTLNFQTGTGGYGITSLRSLGPRGILTGEASLVPRQTDWALALDATIEAREDADGIAAQYLGTDWHWQEGRAEIAGTGTTWGQLVDTLKGDLNVSGSHQANVATPVSISAQLGTQSDALVLESLDVKAGTAHLGGSLAFSGGKQRKLHLKLDGEGVDLNFLFDNPGAESLPGIPVPEYLTLVPGIEVTWEVTARDLSLPGLQLARAEISADRGVDRGRFQVRGRGDQAGALAVSLNYQPGGGGKTFVNMTVEMDKLDLEHLITGDEGLFNEKTTGNLVLNSRQ